MSDRPFYAWFPADYLAKTLDLTPQQDLVYRRMLDMSWMTRQALPDDKLRLLIGLRLPSEFWSDVELIRTRFFRKTERGWVNPRMSQEERRVAQLSEKRRAAAQARWGGEQDAQQYQLSEPDTGQVIVADGPTELMTQAIAMWNAVATDCDRLPAYNRNPEDRSKTRAKVLARITETSIDTWGQACAIVAASPFLRGEVKDWRASFGWLAGPENFDKVIGGNYKVDGEKPAKGGRTKTDDIRDAARDALARLREKRNGQ